jgi:hypothetical protein
MSVTSDGTLCGSSPVAHAHFSLRLNSCLPDKTVFIFDMPH